MTNSGKDASLRALISLNDEYVPFRHIESINRAPGTPEDNTINKLKGDEIIRVTTTSGKTHGVSIRYHITLLAAAGHTVNTLEDMWQIILNDWLD